MKPVAEKPVGQANYNAACIPGTKTPVLSPDDSRSPIQEATFRVTRQLTGQERRKTLFCYWNLDYFSNFAVIFYFFPYKIQDSFTVNCQNEAI